MCLGQYTIQSRFSYPVAYLDHIPSYLLLLLVFEWCLLLSPDFFLSIQMDGCVIIKHELCYYCICMYVPSAFWSFVLFISNRSDISSLCIGCMWRVFGIDRFLSECQMGKDLRLFVAIGKCVWIQGYFEREKKENPNKKLSHITQYFLLYQIQR